MKKRNIFIVDDELFYANIIADFITIKKLGETKVFPTAEMMLDQLYENPDVIILDINLPGINGDEVIGKIKEFNPDIYVLMMSSQSDIMTAVNTLKHGAFDYIIKDHKAFKKLVEILKKIEDLEALREKMYFSWHKLFGFNSIVTNKLKRVV